MRNHSQDYVAQGLMRDLRVLVGAEALLSAFEGGPTIAEALILVQRHASSAADHANRLLLDLREQENRCGDDVES